MLRSLTFLLFVLPALLPAAAQQPVAPELPDAPEARHSRLRAAKGYYYDDIDGEYCKVIVLNDIAVYPQLKFKNKKEEDFYWKTVYNVRKTLPFAKLICETLIETYEYIETFPTQAERDEYLKRMESARCSANSYAARPTSRATTSSKPSSDHSVPASGRPSDDSSA